MHKELCYTSEKHQQHQLLWQQVERQTYQEVGQLMGNGTLRELNACMQLMLQFNNQCENRGLIKTWGCKLHFSGLQSVKWIGNEIQGCKRYLASPEEDGSQIAREIKGKATN